MDHYDHLALERRGDVLIVTLSRPERLNALNPKVMAELGDLFMSLDDSRSDTRVVILRGEGKHFCAGADIDNFC